MEEKDKKLDMKELGRRFKQIRQHLGLTQTEVANQLETSQLMVSFSILSLSPLKHCSQKTLI